MLKRGRGVNFFMGVDDVDQYYRELTERGAEVWPPADEGWGGRFITLQIPTIPVFFRPVVGGEIREDTAWKEEVAPTA